MVIEGTKEEARIRKSFCSFNEREFGVKKLGQYENMSVLGEDQKRRVIILLTLFKKIFLILHNMYTLVRVI